jgi:hypothetical protein
MELVSLFDMTALCHPATVAECQRAAFVAGEWPEDAQLALQLPGARGRSAPAKPANGVATGFGAELAPQSPAASSRLAIPRSVASVLGSCWSLPRNIGSYFPKHSVRDIFGLAA